MTLQKPDCADIPSPRFLYGTAWKENETQRLTELALRQGFRGIDTANQRRHYYEAAVGEAIKAAIASRLVTRQDLFLQTKFTFRSGQDHRLPYDPAASIATQVEQSFASSLEHLGTEFIDSYVLHGPTQRIGLAPDDWAAWRAMEEIHDSGRVRLLGVSNVTLEQLKSLHHGARIRPRFVQKPDSGIPLSQPTQAEAAGMLNVSVDSVKQARKIRKTATPETVAAVERGEITLNAAVETVKPAKATEKPVAAKPADPKMTFRSRAEKTHDIPLPASTRTTPVMTFTSKPADYRAYTDGAVALFGQADSSADDPENLDDFCQSLFDKMQHESAEQLCQWFMDKLGWKREKKWTQAK
ncbi:MAG: aldo/keto reductase [Planctomycetales bacterium]|nr:aldo/keto reductase [Planctomycetales bacterium]